MARGNQRDKAREANQKKMASMVSLPTRHPHSRNVPRIDIRSGSTPPLRPVDWHDRSSKRYGRGGGAAARASSRRTRDRIADTRGLQKKGNAKSGSELARDKEIAAQKMREKQAAGINPLPFPPLGWTRLTPHLSADAKRAEEAAAAKK